MDEQKLSFRWCVLSLAVVNLFFGIIAKESIPPLFSEIRNQIFLSKVQMGTTIGVVSLAALFFAVFGGAFSDRFGSRLVFGGAVLIMAVSGAFRGFAGIAYEFIAMMFILGIGAAILGPSLLKALGTWFSSRQLAMANGILFQVWGSAAPWAWRRHQNISPRCAGGGGA